MVERSILINGKTHLTVFEEIAKEPLNLTPREKLLQKLEIAYQFFKADSIFFNFLKQENFPENAKRAFKHSSLVRTHRNNFALLRDSLVPKATPTERKNIEQSVFGILIVKVGLPSIHESERKACFTTTTSDGETETYYYSPCSKRARRGMSLDC
jgi:hypothetical protein